MQETFAVYGDLVGFKQGITTEAAARELAQRLSADNPRDLVSVERYVSATAQLNGECDIVAQYEGGKIFVADPWGNDFNNDDLRNADNDY